MAEILKKLPFYRAYTTKQNVRYWKAKNDPEYWKEYQQTWKHPRRQFIAAVLSHLPWFSLMELGCGSGPNIINLVKLFPGRQYGGIDINEIAIDILGKTIQGGVFKVGSTEDIMMSDHSSDIILTDMTLIYIGPLKIRKSLKEIHRVTRNFVVLNEYHSDKWFARVKLRIFSGRHAYNYRKLLSRNGFYDIQIYKTPAVEPDNEEKFRHIITAKCSH